MTNSFWDFFKNKKISYKILLCLFALLFTKSITITPFSLVSGVLGVILGIVLWISIYCALFFAAYLAEKVSLKFKKTAVNKSIILLYMLPSLILCSAMLAVYFPAIMSWDSMYIWQSAMTGDYSSLHPITYVLFVKLLSNIAQSPWIVVAVQLIYSSFVFGYIGYVFESMGLSRKLCWLAVLILSFYPVHVYSNISMLKDVLYIMSLVLLSAILIKSVSEDRFTFGTAGAVAGVALIAMFSRHNGLLSVPPALVIFAIYYFVKKKRAEAIKAVAVAILAVVCFFVTNEAIVKKLGNNYWERSSASDIIMTPTAQLTYTINKNWKIMSESEQEAAEKFLDLGYIKFQADTIKNWEFNNRYLESIHLENIMADKQGFMKFYLDIFKNYPHDMIKEYEQLTGIVWAAPDYGYTLVRNYGIPKDYPDLDMRSAKPFPRIYAYLDSLGNIYFLVRPALWLMLSIFTLFIVKKGHRLSAFIIALPTFANAAGYLFGTPAQNVRYLYSSFSCFIILLVFAFMVNGIQKTKADKAALQKEG